MNATFLQEALHKRTQENALRHLRPESQLIDLCSNDYLGFSVNRAIWNAVQHELERAGLHRSGATGSRLLTGNTRYVENLEAHIASFHQAEAALIFNSGYDANLGLISSLASRHDTMLYDSLSHASIIDGVRLSRAANKMKFAHNNADDLDKKLREKSGNAFVIIESLYSMDGDLAPLREIADVCRKHDALLIVDEAHATGIFGGKGEGLVVEENLVDSVFARIFTFGKALGTHGAAVTGSRNLREYLVNFARSFIYTTALPAHTLANIQAAYTYLSSAKEERTTLFNNIAYFGRVIKETFNEAFAERGPVQSFIIPGNEKARELAGLLQSRGYDIRPILSPTVEQGKERLRICIHSFNTQEQFKDVVRIIKENIE